MSSLLWSWHVFNVYIYLHGGNSNFLIGEPSQVRREALCLMFDDDSTKILWVDGLLFTQTIVPIIAILIQILHSPLMLLMVRKGFFLLLWNFYSRIIIIFTIIIIIITIIIIIIIIIRDRVCLMLFLLGFRFLLSVPLLFTSAISSSAISPRAGRRDRSFDRLRTPGTKTTRDGRWGWPGGRPRHGPGNWWGWCRRRRRLHIFVFHPVDTIWRRGIIIVVAVG